MTGRKLLDVERVVRQIGWAKLRKDAENNVLGPSYNAFILRDGEEYLSVVWCEYFDGAKDVQRDCAIHQLRNARQVGAKTHYWIAAVGDIKKIMISAGCRPRFIHEPVANIASHAAVRRWRDASDDLLELLAADCISELVSNADVVDAAELPCLVRGDL